MEMEHKSIDTKVLTKNLTRETLFKLFIKSNAETIDISDVDEIDEAEDGAPTDGTPTTKEPEVRHRAEKLLFLSMLMDDDLENQIERRKNSKYDYMIGLMLYISSNPRFKYCFGYFKESISAFDKMLGNWCAFLNSVISDVNAIGKISFAHDVIIQFTGILRIEIYSDVIAEVSVNMDNFSELFGKCGSRYNFDILVREGAKLIPVASGESDGSGDKSGLCCQIFNINNTYESLYISNESLILFTHGH